MTTSPALARSLPPRPASPPSVLIVDDEPQVARVLARMLGQWGYDVDVAGGGAAALAMAEERRYDVVVTDVSMPDMDGVELLRRLRARHRDLPVVLLTGGPALETAMQAVEYGALRYIVKPVEPALLEEVVRQAALRHTHDQALHEALPSGVRLVLDRAEDPGNLERELDESLASAWMAYQPIVRWSRSRVHGCEALLRSRHPRLSTPLHVIGAAEVLGRLPELGRAVRRLVAAGAAGIRDGVGIFVNVHPRDLDDADLFDPAAPLSALARRVVLELTERAPLAAVDGLEERIGRLRLLGYRIAVDDLGEGYAGLSSVARLQPDIVKIDMSLVRGIDGERSQQRVVGGMRSLCSELGAELVAEGVETSAELVTLRSLGCDLFQGYLIGRPAALQ